MRTELHELDRYDCTDYRDYADFMDLLIDLLVVLSGRDSLLNTGKIGLVVDFVVVGTFI